MSLNGAAPLRVLVIAPTPTHPAIQGNRQRIFDMCRAMQSVGADMTFLYYAVDGLDVAGARNMKEMWGNLEVVFPSGFVPTQGLVRYSAIDDWYDEEIGRAAARLNSEKNFDVCVVNYCWYSKAFESIPQKVVRVIDTHDVFGGRAERFTELDLDPEWFHTSVEQEAIGLDRADFVVAIQSLEAEVLHRRSKARVRSIGMLSGADFLPERDRRNSTRLKAGYLGSGNPFNVASMSSLSKATLSSPGAADQFELHVAGSICASLATAAFPLIKHGIVDSTADFYRSIDVFVNPMGGGTGLKIKSLEALGYGKPLVATNDAMTGIPSDHDGHMLKDSFAVVQQLCKLSAQPQRLSEEAAISRSIFRSYRETQLQQFSHFWSEIEREVNARRV